MPRTVSERLVFGVMLAAVLVLAAQVLPAGVSAAADATGVAAKKKRSKAKKPKVRVRTRTVTKTVTVTAPAAPPSGQLVGTFKLNQGSYSGGAAHGSWFRMILPGGSAKSGPYFANPDSTAADPGYTLLSPGTDGGLNNGGLQPSPSPALDQHGNALAGRIIKPQKFAGVNFSAATAKEDPQTGATVIPPTLTADKGRLTGDLRAFAAQWNNQSFNQGSPKPDGTSPGITSTPTGTYDEGTGAFVLEWTSSIVGGPFNGFTGQWHLEGSFVSCV